MPTLLRAARAAGTSAVALAAATLAAVALAAVALTAGAAGAKPLKIVTSPAGAACQARQGAGSVGYLPETPGFLEISTESPGLLITCRKAGYADATYEIGDPDTPFVDVENYFDYLEFSRIRARLRRLDRVDLTLSPK